MSALVRASDDEPNERRSLPPEPAVDVEPPAAPRLIPRRRGWRLPPAPR